MICIDPKEPVIDRSLKCLSGKIITKYLTVDIEKTLPTSFKYDSEMNQNVFVLNGFEVKLSQDDNTIGYNGLQLAILSIDLKLDFDGYVKGRFTDRCFYKGLEVYTGSINVSEIRLQGSKTIHSREFGSIENIADTDSEYRQIIIHTPSGDVKTDDVYFFFGAHSFVRVQCLTSHIYDNWVVFVQTSLDQKPYFVYDRRSYADFFGEIRDVLWDFSFVLPNGSVVDFNKGDKISLRIISKDGFPTIDFGKYDQEDKLILNIYIPITFIYDGNWRSKPGINVKQLLIYNNWILEDGTRIFQEGDHDVEDVNCWNDPILMGYHMKDLNAYLNDSNIVFYDDDKNVCVYIDILNNICYANGKEYKFMDIRQLCYSRVQNMRLEESDIIQKQTKKYSSIEPQEIIIDREPSKDIQTNEIEEQINFIFTNVAKYDEIQRQLRLIDKAITEGYPEEQLKAIVYKFIETFVHVAVNDEGLYELFCDVLQKEPTKEELEAFLMSHVKTWGTDNVYKYVINNYKYYMLENSAEENVEEVVEKSLTDVVEKSLTETAKAFTQRASTTVSSPLQKTVIEPDTSNLIGYIPTKQVTYGGITGTVMTPKYTLSVDFSKSLKKLVANIAEKSIEKPIDEAFHEPIEKPVKTFSLRAVKATSRAAPSENSFNSETGVLTIVETCYSLDIVNGTVKEIVADDNLQCFASNVNLQRLNLNTLPRRILGGVNIGFVDTFRKTYFNSDLSLSLDGGSYESVFQDCDFNGHSVILYLNGECDLSGMFDQTKNLKNLKITGGRITGLERLVACSKELETLEISSQLFGTISFRRMCFCCKSLKHVDFSMSDMELFDCDFNGTFFCCKSLEKCDMGHYKSFCSVHPNVSFLYSFNNGTLMEYPFDFSKTLLFRRVMNERKEYPKEDGEWFVKKNSTTISHMSIDGTVLEEITEETAWMPYNFASYEDGQIINNVNRKHFVGEIIEDDLKEFEQDESLEKNVFRNVETDKYLISSETGIPLKWMIFNNDYPE